MDATAIHMAEKKQTKQKTIKTGKILHFPIFGVVKKLFFQVKIFWHKRLHKQKNIQK